MRGRGIGQALWKAATEHCNSHGVTNIGLTATASECKSISEFCCPRLLSSAVEPIVSDDPTIAYCSFIRVAEFFLRENLWRAWLWVRR